MSQRKPNNNLNDNVSAQNDHLTDFASVDDLLRLKSRIIFSKNAFLHLVELMQQTMCLPDHTERGCFFLGKELGKDTDRIIFDDFTTDFSVSDAYFKGGANDCNSVLKPSKRWPKGELVERIDKGNYDCCAYFHTHPLRGHFDVFADLDLMLFEILSDRYKNVNWFSVLATPNRNTRLNSVGKFDNVQISAIYYERTSNGKFEYYRFPSISYVDKGEIIEIGKYDRIEAPSLTGRIYVPRRATVQAIGKDPNTGETIENKKIGKINNGRVCIDDDDAR